MFTYAGVCVTHKLCILIAGKSRVCMVCYSVLWLLFSSYLYAPAPPPVPIPRLSHHCTQSNKVAAVWHNEGSSTRQT